MSAKRIQILGLKTWGKLGNQLAANKLMKILKTTINCCQVNVDFGDEILPDLKVFGYRIRTLSKTSMAPSDRYASYKKIIDDVEKIYPYGFEKAGSALTSNLKNKLEPMVNFIRKQNSDIIISTKGVLARIVLAARNQLQSKTKIISYVTNPGLLELDIHVSPFLDYMIPFEKHRRFLISRGVHSDNIHVVGPSIAAKDLTNIIAHDQCIKKDSVSTTNTNQGVLIFSNYGGKIYLKFLESVLSSINGHDVGCIIIGEPEILRSAKNKFKQAKYQKNNRNLLLFGELEQDRFLDMVLAYRKKKGSFLITKTGPNTVLEAANIGIPVMVHWSGLPMERWVVDFVNDHKIGIAEMDPEKLSGHIDTWVKNPDILLNYANNIKKFKSAFLSNSRHNKVLSTLVSEYLELTDDQI